MENQTRQGMSQGKLLRSDAGREIAVYRRDGCAWVVEFNGHRWERHAASVWFARRGRGRQGPYVGQAGDIPAEVRARIDALHDAELRPAALRIGGAVPFLLESLHAGFAPLRRMLARQAAAPRGAFGR